MIFERNGKNVYMTNIDEEKNTIKVTYAMQQVQFNPYVKTISIDTEKLQKAILLELYDSDMLKIKFSRECLANIVYDYVYEKCYQDAYPRRNPILISDIDVYKPISLLYAKGLIDSTEQNDSAYFTLTESGMELCKKYLLEQ